MPYRLLAVPALLLQTSAALLLAAAVGAATGRPERALLVGATALLVAAAAGRSPQMHRGDGAVRLRGVAVGAMVLLGVIGP